ncbi:squalene-hopene/tetraprenyl-beta-curcumene cyclase [Rhodopseudomonas rhenobacensis]|uniref:Squalene-hopene/tetraprenyl-beta-curcumene cyclase n=1 Tax=Rhodopseudomonas rhenobacensis TaxID=87461 RepID=A0A7W8DZD5_9BRAD|nr:squalene--hopene cyclase [Rhodopseudomonas rhenobacensis]MBB5047750.1 squalene-hopene/tetraprenyl-beta-curcumene cyclase [Rhodopseudomonas rhenobacensis]
MQSGINEQPMIGREALDASIDAATRALLGFRQDDGHWVFELEADCTIPSEYLLLRHYLGEPGDVALEAKIGNYLRRLQGAHGGWALVHDGAFDISASVKAYFALKMIGDDVDAPHMAKAREAIRSRGGAIHSNVFTRFMLSMFGITTWRSVPVLPVEIMLLPMWSPFHLNKISYWARVTIVPLMVLAALKPRAVNRLQVGLDELFLQDPKSIGMPAKAPHQSWALFKLFAGIDTVLRTIEPWFPKRLRAYAIGLAVKFIEERLNGEDGLGAIYPPMANTVMMYKVLGYPEDYPPRAITRRGIDKLLVIGDDEAYCQPCVSPIWDTALSCHALLEVGGEAAVPPAKRGIDWLAPKQVLDLKGDWAVKRPELRPGGWAFQYNNAHYPDLDDTAVVVMAMDRSRRATGSAEYDEAIARAREWIEGMQSDDGGWAAFDVNNLEYYLNNIPFSDHGAMLDPPTEDVTARCVSMLSQLGETAASSKPLADGLAYLRRTQLPEGSWYGRWGMNYIYGTWSVLCALNAAGLDHQDPAIRKAVAWLESVQNADGGWGEDAESYRLDYKGYQQAPSTASQTSWALLALMAAGEVESAAVARGVEYLKSTQSGKGYWDEQRYTATGFPRVFYLRYHGYAKFFPLWALARYRNLRSTNSKAVGVGM